MKAGIFSEEIIPVEIRGQTISVDDTVRPGVTAQSLASLKPVFPDWGQALTTAGNASGVGDGAAIAVLTTRKRAEAEGMEILGKWVAATFVGVEPRHMGIAPIAAIPKVLADTGLSKEEIDVFEVSDKLACVLLPSLNILMCNRSMKPLRLSSHTVLNSWTFQSRRSIRSESCLPLLTIPIVIHHHSGGAIALTHPLGMSASFYFHDAMQLF